MVTESDAVFQKLSEQFHDGKEVPFLSEAVKAELIKNVQRRMTPQPLKIRADVELTCYAYDGVLHIQVSPSDSIMKFVQLTLNLGLSVPAHNATGKLLVQGDRYP